jgi:hypothetical protein
MSLEDRAQDHEAWIWEMNNGPRTKKRVFTPQDPEYGPEVCAECEDDMPECRRAYGYRLCVACATAAEKLGRLGR